jgi:hypothetical protein
MNQAKEVLYVPVQDNEEDEILPFGSFRKTSKSSWVWRFLLLEVFHLALILGVYGLYSVSHHQNPIKVLLPQTDGHELDSCKSDLYLKHDYLADSKKISP